eukprot:1475570-Lingulodinium_polyedra.AAC.1
MASYGALRSLRRALREAASCHTGPSGSTAGPPVSVADVSSSESPMELSSSAAIWTQLRVAGRATAAASPSGAAGPTGAPAPPARG